MVKDRSLETVYDWDLQGAKQPTTPTPNPTLLQFFLSASTCPQTHLPRCGLRRLF